MKTRFLSSLVLIPFIITACANDSKKDDAFYVSLKNSSVKLSLFERMDFSENSTYLSVRDGYDFVEYSYGFFKDKLDVLDQDNNTVPFNLGEIEQEYVDKDGYKRARKCLEFFKYTFYVKNIGEKTAAYNLSINLDKSMMSDDGTDRGLDETLRVMVFENQPDRSDHECKVYAKRAVEYNYDINGDKTTREFISVRPLDGSNREDDEHPLAETFVDESTVVRYDVNNFAKNDMMRYTIVYWLEGEDPQSNSSIEYPEGSSLKLNVEIYAREQE